MQALLRKKSSFFLRMCVEKFFERITVSLHQQFRINSNWDYSMVTLHNCFRINDVTLKRRAQSTIYSGGVNDGLQLQSWLLAELMNVTLTARSGILWDHMEDCNWLQLQSSIPAEWLIDYSYRPARFGINLERISLPMVCGFLLVLGKEKSTRKI